MSTYEKLGRGLKERGSAKSKPDEKDLPKLQEILNETEHEVLKFGIVSILSKENENEIVEKLFKKQVVDGEKDIQKILNAQKEAQKAKVKIDQFIEMAKSKEIIKQALIHSQKQGDLAYQDLVKDEALIEAVADPKNLMKIYVEKPVEFGEIMDKTSQFVEFHNKAFAPLKTGEEAIQSKYGIGEDDFNRLIDIEDQNEAEKQIKKYVQENVSFIPRLTFEMGAPSLKTRKEAGKIIRSFRKNWKDFLDKSEKKLEKVGEELRKSIFDEEFVKKLMEIAQTNKRESSENPLGLPQRLLENDAGKLHEDFKEYIGQEWSGGVTGFNDKWPDQRYKDGGEKFRKQFLETQYPQMAGGSSFFSKTLMEIFDRILKNVEKYT
ncbi:MAG: hypothetical protein GF335_01670 [Candidatus Moranbacteria bacterium]|nr:hypothetical protein [Candidatus Moranbacteria bacterium]